MNSQSLNEAVCNDGSFFSLEYEIAKDGNQTLKVNGKYLHSKMRPSEEGKNEVYLDKTVIALYGYGLGYFAENVSRQNPNSLIISFEPINELFIKAQKENQDIPKNLILINTNDSNNIFKICEQYLDIAFYRFITLITPGYRNIENMNCTNFFEAVSKAYKMYIQNIMTESRFIPLWFKNTVRSFLNTAISPIVEIENKEMDYDIAIVCGAGPTLNGYINLLKENRECFTVFATDTAYPSLIEQGIIPDVVVSLDGQHWSVYDFVTISSDEIDFIFDVGGLSRIDRVKNRKTVIHSYKKNSVEDWFLSNLGVNYQGINTGGTVSDFTLDIAVRAGYKHIFLAGYDLSFPLFTSHAKNTPYHKRSIFSQNYLLTIDSQCVETVSRRNPVIGHAQSGKEVFTDFVMTNYRSYLESYISIYNDINFYSLSQDAVAIKGVNYISSDMFEKLLSRSSRKKMFYSTIVGKDNKLKEISDSMLNNFFEYTIGLKEVIEKVGVEIDEKCASLLIDRILGDYPFLKSFLIMTDILIDSKDIFPTSIQGIKHRSFRLLQSLYYCIRTLQKS